MEQEDPGVIGWANAAYESEDDELLPFEDVMAYAVEDDSDESISELESDEEDEILLEDSCQSDFEEASGAAAGEGVRLLRTEPDDVKHHGVHTSVPHHQCCDSLCLADPDSDSLLFTEGMFAVLYDIAQGVLVSATDLRFKPYSIARHEDMFAAVGVKELKIFYLRPDPKKGLALTFQLAAQFRVGTCSMNNGVRFGRLGNEWKLLVASQDCFVYVFNVPGAPKASSAERPGAPSSTGARPGPVAVKDFLSNNLKKHYFPPVEAQPGIVRREPPSVRGLAGEDLTTDVIGRFKAPLNCVAASPDGKLLAVVGDSACVWVLDQANGFSTSNMATLNLNTRVQRNLRRGYRGCQYVAWNSSSNFLAVSSDTDCVVRVWYIKPPAVWSRPVTRSSPRDVASAQAVTTFVHHDSCLALQFSPVDPYLLYYAESPSSPGAPPRLHCADLRFPPQASQTLTLTDYEPTCPPAQFPLGGCSEGHKSALQCVKADCPGYKKWQKPGSGGHPPPGIYKMNMAGRWWGVREMQVTGLAVSKKHGVLVALQGGGEHGVKNQVLQFRTLGWTYETHRLFPQMFKDMTRFLLLAASAEGKQAEGGSSSIVESSSGPSFRSLPKDLIYKIIEQAAMPQSAWLTRSCLPDESDAQSH